MRSVDRCEVACVFSILVVGVALFDNWDFFALVWQVVGLDRSKIKFIQLLNELLVTLASWPNFVIHL